MARKPEPPSLAGQPWLADPHLQKLLRVLNSEGEARVAGGAVRNALLGEPVSDVDVAAALRPERVMALCKAAGFGVHPTGIDHGTVTITVKGQPFEVTTLRRDVETDGRHASVAFTTDWREDASRRDFTINAMYCDADGKTYDFTNCYEDILKRRVRFVGKAATRIREDYLRILRFFRFHARYGRGAPDKAGLAACAALKGGIAQLSAERLRQEMLKLLEAPRAVPALKAMARHGILRQILPHTEDWRVIGRLPADGVLRLFALARSPHDLKDALRLSNADASRIAALQAAPELSPRLTLQERRRMIYGLGREAWRDAAHLSWAKGRAGMDDPAWRSLAVEADSFTAPAFPVSGRDLAAAGMAPGPAMGRALSALEDWWLASDFKPGKEELLQRLTKVNKNGEGS